MSGPAPIGLPAGETIEGAAPKEWPSPPARYWALVAIIFATFVTFFDQTVFGMLGERIKHDFGLTDGQLGFIGGPAAIICYFFVGIPLARLADIWPRKYVLSGGIALVGLITALGGLAQNFVQFVGSRVFLAAGGSAHAPSSYSLIADAFPPRIITRAFALLQFGFIGGVTLGPMIGGLLIGMTAHWEPTTIFGGTQDLRLAVDPDLDRRARHPRLLHLPDGQGAAASGARRRCRAASCPMPAFGRQIITFMGWDAAKAIHANGRVYYPLFAALALSAVEVFGLQFWRTPFMIRSFGWTEAQIGPAIGFAALIGSLAGLVLGAILVELLGKRYRDANVRAAFICFCGTTVSTLVALMIPSAWGSIIAFGFAGMFGLAGAVPQNAAIQRVAPNSMRGQVTAFYLFMFTFFGAMGSFVIGLVAQYIVVDPLRLREALLLTAGMYCCRWPVSCMFRAMKPYRAEIARLEALGR